MSSIVTSAEELKAQNGNKLAAVALEALKTPGFVSERGMCQKFVRQVIQAVYGAQFNKYHSFDAEDSRRLWAGSPYAVAPSRGSMIGDILYKRGTPSSPHGHVGIRIAGNRVAENSIVHNGAFGGRGVRSLKSFGKVDLIVRLPRVE